MGSFREFHDVFLGFQKLLFCDSYRQNPVLKPHVDRFTLLQLEDWTHEHFISAISILSQFILIAECVDAVLECFPHSAGTIVANALEKEEIDHQIRYVCLGKLFANQSNVIQSFLRYFDDQKPPWQSHDVITPSKKSKKRKMSARQVSDLEIVECCWNLLRADFRTFSTKWCWSGFLDKFVTSKDEQVLWVACQCLAKVLAMDETCKIEFMKKLLEPSKIVEIQLRYEKSPVFQTRLKLPTPSTPAKNVVNKEDSRVSSLSTTMYADFGGVILPIFKKDQVQAENLVLVESTIANLRRIAIGVSTNKAVGLMGPVGCGKSALVEHLANSTGRRTDIELLKVQLGEETDSKLLLGTYKCTDVPGEFIWEPGILTKAVIGGHWLLIEDIESAASDVAAVLANLLEYNTINVPGYRDNVPAAPGFHLFMTHRLLPGGHGHHRKQTTATELLEKHWLQVSVEPLTTDELIHIIQVKFPLLKTIASRMVAVYMLFAAGEHEGGSNAAPRQAGQRLISTRDLLKWCARAECGFEVTSPESALKVLQDAIDIFCCSYSNLAFRSMIAGEMSACLGIIKTKAEYFCNLYKPSITLDSKSCIAGRAQLVRSESGKPVTLEQLSDNLRFALTRESSCLLERLAVCLSLNEPVLIVGETGTGKTTTIQLLAKHTRHKLIVINMNQQSDSSDLLGGYKPVDLKQTIVPIREEFEHLFRSLFNVQSNQKFLENISVCVSKRMWTTLLKMMAQSQSAALKRLMASGSVSHKEVVRWRELGDKINRLQAQLRVNRSAMAFSFIEGSLVKALKKGHWVLLDEINLACAETLQCLSGLLEGTTGSVSLLERGDAIKVPRHPDFRLLAAMNPATDFGKKDLPPGVRNRFTELFVSEHSDKNDLMLVVKCYLPDLPPPKVEAVVNFYILVKRKAADVLVDSTGHRPLYSLRTLCRGLLVAAENKCGNMNRSLYEALCLSFLTQLNAVSHVLVKDMIAAFILDADIRKSVLSQPIPEPSKGKHVCFEGYWVERGHAASSIDEKYLLTPSVRKNLCDIARCVSMSNHPVLIQGETSVGKTSLITYLARAAGHKCYRINNHQHTDLQEYVGTYCADPATGSLVFREGVLVDAMRNGHWIILDELNLAPSEVLEALNRVLDDNRELFITETQVTVKAHPSFRLFATQNPPGLYGGRKMLSRAFRNRFVELHFDEIPPPELENILQHRCNMPLSYCKKLVAVMLDLQVRRRGSATFAGKMGFITLRDLFRWGERYRLAQSSDPGKYYDWDQHIADEGYLVLAGRVRKNEECEIIRGVLEKRIKRTVNVDNLFSLSSNTSIVTKHILENIVGPCLPEEFRHIVWTYNLRKTAVLVGKAIEFCEPLLLVGETGCGKTTICQLIAVMQQQVLYSVNCHQHSESSDFLGGLRPVRDKADEKGKLFEWVDGPLIMAVKDGMMFLADEISLADDSVLERLNSLLEPERRLMVSEKGSDEDVDITAAPRFRFVGTMNPGGDYGKKELSPALRNRLTEVWCEGPTTDEDLSAIVEHNVRPGLSLGNQQDGSSGIGRALIQFLNWFKLTEIGKRIGVSVRDVLTWVRFINLVASNTEDNGTIDVATAFVHGACLTLLDGIGTASTATDNVNALNAFRSSCIEFLLKQVDTALGCDHSSALEVLMKPESLHLEVVSTPEKFGIHPFYINKVPSTEVSTLDFTFEAPTTCLNTLRLIRSLQIPSRAILLEGSPGVGKTSIVTALAKATGHKVTRINLSEQTDISDLFGSDLPVEGAKGGTFAWRDGPFLKALKQGHWILLDELNLASQSVVEGLNSVLDHRGEIFVPELGRTFHIKTDSTRLFACQNPQRQGGARKGLPLSFLNRFTQVFMEPLSKNDLLIIVRGTHPEVDSDLVDKMVELTAQLNEKTKTSSWGSSGGPYEWNLRDLNFWIQSFSAYHGHQSPGAFVKTVYADRLRKPSERQDVLDLYESIFGPKYPLVSANPPVILNSQNLMIGEVSLSRTTANGGKDSTVDACNSLLVLRHQISTLRSLALCVRMGWLSILVGESYSGKTSVLNTLAHLAGKKIFTIPVSSAMDTTELLGGFEQTDHGRHLDSLYQKVNRIVTRVARFHAFRGNFDETHRLLQVWRECNLTTNQSCEEVFTLDKALLIMKKRIENLRRVLSLLGQAEHRCSVRSLSRIVATLDEVDANVEKQSSLTAGNFEWVDSILVKCLEDGNWLVVDNVNLCSGAVLDRLNGLLEPEGVLVLGERGVGPDGCEIIIKPHKDFRIFFTLDPAHGNISRAMRNRGIEIYVERLPLFTDSSPPQVDYSKFSSRLDLLSLLRHMGFTSSAHAQALLHIHTKLTQHCAGYETPHLGHLMDAGFLALQNWKRGQSLLSVTEHSFKDVYIKSRVMSIEQKLKLTSVLSDAINDVSDDLMSESLNFMDCFSDTVMLQTLQLDENSVFECMKYQGGLIHAVMNLFKMVTLSDTLSKNLSSYTLSDFEIFYDTISGTDHKILDTLPFVVIAFYTFASSSDLDLRHAWLQNLAESSPKTGVTQLIYDKILLISDVIRNVLKNGLPASNLPWDPRHLSPLPFGDCSLQNRLHALICYRVVQACDTDESTLTDKKINWKSLTIIQYSNAIKKGVISDLPTNLVIVCEISRLFELLEKIIVRVFNSSKTYFTIDRCWEWLHKVAWKFRLLNITKRRLFSIPPSHSGTLPPVNFESLNYLTQHYKWFRKHTLPMLLELANYDISVDNDVHSLMTLVDLIDESIDLGKIHLIPLCRQVMKLMEQPSPMKTTEQCDLSRKIHRLEDSLKFWKLDLFGLEALSSDCGFLASPKGQECRHKMIVCCEQIFGNCNIIQGGEVAGELESTFETARHQVTGGKEQSVVRMWPFLELVALRLNSALRSVLSQSWEPISTESPPSPEYEVSLKQSLVDWFIAAGCIAPTSVGVIKSGLELSNESSQNLSSVMLHLTSHMHSSFAIHGPLLFLEWEQSTIMDEDDQSTSKMNDVYPQDPMLSVFLGCIVNTLKKTSACGSSLALKFHRNTMGMVHNLRTMLWRNSPVIFSDSLKSSLNEGVFLKNSYTKLLHILSSCLKVEGSPGSVDAICSSLAALNFDSGKTKGHKCDSFVLPVVDTLKSLEQAIDALQTLEKDSSEWWVGVGKCWSLIGYIHLTFFSNLELIDPVHKEAMKRQYRLEELKELKVLLCVQELTRGLVGATGTWPLKEQYESKIVELEAKKECQEGIAVRPYPSRYNKITMELKSFMESLFAHEKFKDIASRLDASDKDAEAGLRTRNEVNSWLMSVRSFHYRLKSQYYASYPDMVTPALLALSQVIWGMQMSLSNMDKSIVKQRLRGDVPFQQIVALLLSVTDISSSSYLVDVCCSSRILSLLKKADEQSSAKKSRTSDDKIRLSKICMRLVRSLRDTYKGESLYNYVFRVLDFIVDSWEKLQEENKIKIAQEQSIYINKLTPIQQEEEEKKKEVRQLFPVTREQDFGDLEGPENLEDVGKPSQNPEEKESEKINLCIEDVEEICDIHRDIVRYSVQTPWFVESRGTSDSPFHSSLLNDRVELFWKLLSGPGMRACDENLSSEALPGLLVALSQPFDSASSSPAVVSDSDPDSADFYRDPNVDEATQCIALLQAILSRVEELLAEWPDHPTLKLIKEIILRISGFSISSPLSRFLTGLELLLTRLHEWEENAHDGVSLSRHAASLTNQIISWRRLELTAWKGALMSRKKKVATSARKWWFHLYSLTISYLRGDGQDSLTDELVRALENFMETSNLGEFSTRLQLLLTFHCHCLILPQSERQKQLTHVFWNIHRFYEQFSHQVLSKISELGAPIEKKLKEYVKIARWNDINYWAVKAAVEKTHNTVYKHIKDYEKMLLEPAKCAMTKLSSGSPRLKLPTINFTNYLTQFKPLESYEEASDVDLENHLLRLESLLRKSRRNCKDIITLCSYPSLLKTLNVHLQEWKDVGELICQFDIDPNIPQEKKRAAAKVLLQRKRRAVADMLRTLSQLGLSYRSGLHMYEESNTSFALLPPLDIKVGVQQMSSKQCDQDLVTSWKGTDEIFLTSVAQYAQLKRSLEQSHKDLGPITIEKLKGFTAYLTQMAREIKESLSQNSLDLYSVRCLLYQIGKVSDGDLQGVNSTILHSNQSDVLTEIDNLIYTLKQFGNVLDACPEKSQFIDFKEMQTVFSTSINRPMVNAYKNDDKWNHAKSEIDTLIRTASKLKDDINKTKRHRALIGKTNPSLFNSVDTIVLKSQLETFQRSHTMLTATATELQKMVDSFGSDINGSLCLNPLTRCLEDLTARLSKVGSLWHSMELSNESLNEQRVTEFSSDLNRLVHKSLILMQNVYKSHVKKSDSNPISPQHVRNAEQDDETFSLEDSHLKEKIVDALNTDFVNLKMSAFSRDLADLLIKLNRTSDSTTYSQCLRILRNVYPLLDQLAYLFQFFLTQQTSTLKLLSKINALLLGIFTEFAKNGYNVPEELREEGEEGEGEETKGGMGLGEGEGEKDVSDQIESLDQLEDAKRPEDYKNQKEEHKDCKEEEKGINMEEDMDGELQDIDKKEDDEGEENEEDDEDPDKEMGETEKGAEALDNEVWGSDSEEEDDGNDELPEDEGNRGSEQTEKEMRAKNDEEGDGEDEQGDDKDDKRRDQKKPEINEMEEQEMDDDQVDPYHGNHPPTPEMEPLEIPDDLNMDGDSSGEDENKEDEENPFDIDKMKEKAVAEDEPENNEGDEDKDGDSSNEQDKGPEEDDGEDGQNEDFSKPEIIREEKEQEEDETKDEEQKENEATADEVEPEENEEEEETTGDALQVEKSSEAKAESSENQKSSSDQVRNTDDAMEQNERRKNENQDEGREEDGSAGAAEKEETEQGGRIGTAGKQQRNTTDNQREDQKRQRPGDSNIERSLGEANEPVKKKLKTIEAGKDKNDNREENMEEGVEEDEQADLYQHIKEAKENAHDTQVIDAATKEQAAEQKPVINKEDEEAETLNDEDEITQMDEDVDSSTEEIPKPKSDNTNAEDAKKENKPKGKKEGDVMEDATLEVEIDGEVVATMSVSRGPDSTYHTQMDHLTSNDDQYLLLSEKDVFRLRQELQEQLATWSQPPAQYEATEAWEKLCTVTSGLSRDLSEQLRLVLEPTTASGLKGDFRTGRRINMRKVIPYIASQFRKDKIWLRRSKPSKREYQIVMAIDDSSSMADNQSKELAFESLALVSRALTLLEAGDLAVLSFGETIKVLHELGQPFTDSSGARLVQQLTFDQKRTKVGALVDYTTALLSSCAKKTDADVAQLLVILSDGRGVMSEGEASVLSAVRSAKHNRIFMIFVIIESPNSKDSILDIRQPCFKDGKLLGITSYMDNFPFPFYLILRDITNLPSVLSDALRQWFELVTNSQ